MTLHPYSRIFAGKTTAPTVNDDSGDGYEIGDIWLDETNDIQYQALDVTVGAAVWSSSTQPTVPQVLYKDTKANIEALADPVEGSIAYATDTNEIGAHNGSAWVWSNLLADVISGGSSGNGNLVAFFGTDGKHIYDSGIPLTEVWRVSNSNIAPTTADITATVNVRYFADISGLTADRNFKLPTPSAIGQHIELHITVGDDTYEFIVKGDTGVTINHGSTATEWSRLFITGESVVLVADSLTNWQVTFDGRIPQRCRIRASALQSFNDASYEKVTFSTTVSDNANIGDLTNDAISPRRAGWYQVSGGVQFENNIIYLRVIIDLLLSATTIINRADIDTASISAFPGLPVATSYPFVAGDYVQLFAYQDNGSASQQDTVDASDNHAHLELFEVLP